MRSGEKVAAAAAVGVGGVLAWRALSSAVPRHAPITPRGQRIVIVGAGFAGMTVARQLAAMLPDPGDVSITLIDQNDFQLFTPMLAEVAGGEIDGRHIVAPARQLSRRIEFIQGVVRQIDLAKMTVVVDPPIDGSSSRTFSADHLVLALGSVANYHHIPGAEQHSIPVKSVTDAIGIRDRVVRCIEAAHVAPDAASRQELLTFVVAGGGFTGIETAGEINDFARAAACRYENLSATEISTIVVEPGDRILSELSADLAGYAEGKLRDRGVRLRLHTKLTSADTSGVTIEPGGRIAARTLIWAGGVKPHPLVETLDCQRGHHGGIVVDHHCEVAGHPGVWALGDCAEVPKPGKQGTYPPTAQNATREGALVARNIVAALRREPLTAFAFTPVGELALIGRRTGVASLYGHHFSGLFAWALWRGIYLAKMPLLAQRSRIAADWILDALFGRIIADAPSASVTRP